jgi:hypothetical protein
MSTIDLEQLKASIFERLRGDDEMAGLSIEDLAAAMSHPLANEVVAELAPLEATSVQQGEAARDFELPFLPGHGGQEGGRLRLSERLARRPVALVFGSYT